AAVADDLILNYNFTFLPLTDMVELTTFNFSPLNNYQTGLETYQTTRERVANIPPFGELGASFTLPDVTSATRRYIDPLPTVPNDEYYIYTINLTDGTTRETGIAEFSTVFDIAERFSHIGYTDNPLALIEITETDDTNGFLESVTGRLFGNTSFDEPSLPSLNVVGDVFYTPENIKRLYIYPDADVVCPANQPLRVGYVYELMVRDYNTTDQGMVLTAARCGTTAVSEVVGAISSHLTDTYNFRGLTLDALLPKSFFVDGEFDHSLGIITYTINNALPPDTTVKTVNTTNTVQFEVKATDQAGNTLVNWTDQDLQINEAVELHFRWNAINRYRQCLAFLNDDTYELTRPAGDQLTFGDTEAERYNVNEATYVYRVECSGQDTGEAGVDVQRIEITVE
ncbi:MAG: hypothetical protein AAFO91_10905, partial [Bacteroidota bacterium]